MVTNVKVTNVPLPLLPPPTGSRRKRWRDSKKERDQKCSLLQFADGERDGEMIERAAAFAFMKMRLGLRHTQKRQTNRRKDRQTDGRTDIAESEAREAQK